MTVVYSPPFNRQDDEAELRRLVAEARAGWLVTGRPDAAPSATYLPVLWRDDTVIAHVAKANAHWREIDDKTPALLIVTGPETSTPRPTVVPHVGTDVHIVRRLRNLEPAHREGQRDTAR